MSTRRRVLGAALTFALVFVAVPASAQLWRGAPAGEAVGIGANAGFPDGYDIFGAEVFKGFGQLEAGLEYSLLNGEDESDHVFGANLGFTALEGLDSLYAAGVVVGARYNSFDDGNLIQVPLGVSVLGRIPAGSGIAVQPYAVPALYWTRVSYDGDDEIGDFSDSETDFGFRAGANVLVQALMFGAFYEKVGDGDGTFYVNVAYRFGGPR